jgi:hypothetical protein
MKKFQILLMVVVSVAIASCTEYSDPNSIKNTTWRCNDLSSIQSQLDAGGQNGTTVKYNYWDITFNSTTSLTDNISMTATVSGSGGVTSVVQMPFVSTYTLKNGQITITDSYQGQSDTRTGTFKGKTLTLTSSGASLVFTKK